MTYFGELKTHSRTLVATAVGLSAGYTINNYTNNIFVPNLLREFAWSKSQMALIGLTLIISAACQPVAGRIADQVGVRRMVLVGLLFTPLVYVGFSLMNGSFMQFFWLNVLQIVTVTTTTGPVVYSRAIAEKFSRARGTALAIATCSPAVAGGLCVPPLSVYINTHGWRAGYIALAICATIGCACAYLLLPRHGPGMQPGETVQRRQTVGYRAIFSSRVFQLLMTGAVLCNFSITMQVTQLKVIFLDRGTASDTASWLVSSYAAGVIVGRLVCGFTLDRFPAHVVAALALGVPCIGLVLLAAGVSSPPWLALAAITLGLSLGAEGDAIGYLVRRHFRIDVFSSVLGLIVGAIALSGGLGSLILSASLKMTGRFTLFLLICAVATLLGSVALLLVGRYRSDLEIGGVDDTGANKGHPKIDGNDG